MDGIWMAAAGLLLGAGVAVGLALRRQALELGAWRRRAEELASEARRLAEDRARLAAELAAERDASAERQAEAQRTREAVRAEVEKHAGRVLDEKGKVLHDQ